MTLGKIKNLFLACLIMAALLFGLALSNVVFAYADEEGGATGSSISLIGSDGKNFIYSAEFTPEGEAKAVGLAFGIDDKIQNYWVATADIENNLVKLSEKDVELKSAGCSFSEVERFKITLIVNEGVAKVYMDDSNVAAITCKLDGYDGGELGLDISGGIKVGSVTFTQTDTLDGDIFCGGYDVLKVVNLTDGNYKLNANEYSMKGGVLTVSESYLKTLEAGVEYTFRVVSSFTDLDFKVMTNFTAVTATPAIEKYYKGTEVTLELSENVKVDRLLIDEKEYAFTQAEDRVIISSETVSGLASGQHNVKLYTAKGRPQTTINLSETVETVTEPAVKSSHVWLGIDIAIFASAIIGYVAFSVITKHKNKG